MIERLIEGEIQKEESIRRKPTKIDRNMIKTVQK